MDPEHFVRRGPENVFFLIYQLISQRALRTSLEKHLDPKVSITSRVKLSLSEKMTNHGLTLRFDEIHGKEIGKKRKQLKQVI